MFGRSSLAVFCRGIGAAVACLALAAVAQPAVASPGAPPGVTRTMDLRVPTADVAFPLYAFQAQPSKVYTVRVAGRSIQTISSRDDAIPVGRLRSFASRYAPWRGTPWMAPEPIAEASPD